MIIVASQHALEDVEGALCRAAQQHAAHVAAVTPFRTLLSDEARRVALDAVSFTICHTELYGALLAADIRFAAFLPCRIAAIRDSGGTTLETISPKHFCRHLNRPDLERLVAPLETLLRDLMRDCSGVVSSVAPRPRAHDVALGAREGQVSMRASIPQRIDCHGSKIEDIAGTGKPDALGG